MNKPILSWRSPNLKKAVIEEAAKRIDITKRPRVFIVISSRRNAPSAVRFADEFGSLSTDAEWVSAEMLEGIMKERFPDSGDVTKLCQLGCGDVLPPKQRYEVLIDMRHLKNMDLEEAAGKERAQPAEMGPASAAAKGERRDTPFVSSTRGRSREGPAGRGESGRPPRSP